MTGYEYKESKEILNLVIGPCVVINSASQEDRMSSQL